VFSRGEREVIFMIRKDLIIATLFMIMPTRSSVNPYDPWLDFNDDGTINMGDIGAACNAFGTYGDPTKNVNVTNFPLDENGNLRVSGLGETVANNFLTVGLQKTDYGEGLHPLPWGIWSNSTEAVVGNATIVILGGQASGGLSWSWVSGASNVGSVAGTGGWSQAVGRVYLYDSNSDLVGSLSLPLDTKVRIQNVGRIMLTVEIPIPNTNYNAGWYMSSCAADASVSVFWSVSE
jgi:hypothetical protein